MIMRRKSEREEEIEWFEGTRAHPWVDVRALRVHRNMRARALMIRKQQVEAVKTHCYRLQVIKDKINAWIDLRTDTQCSWFTSLWVLFTCKCLILTAVLTGGNSSEADWILAVWKGNWSQFTSLSYKDTLNNDFSFRAFFCTHVKISLFKTHILFSIFLNGEFD